MSSRLLGIAFAADIKPHAYKLVMLKLVDAARDDGTKIFPSVETIAKAAGVSERHTQRVLKGFVALGLLHITSQGGKGPRDTTEYALDVGLLDRLGTSLSMAFVNETGTLSPKGDMPTPSKKGDAESTERVTSEAKKGDARVTQPLRPLSDPSIGERDAREREGQGSQPTAIRFLPPDDTQREEAFQKVRATYPPEAVDNLDRARNAFADVEEGEWIAAAEAVPRFLRKRKEINRSTIVSLETYIRDRKWRDFPPPTDAKGKPVDDKAAIAKFSRGAWALFRRRFDAGKPVSAELSWIRNGCTIPAATAPADNEMAALAQVGINTPEHEAWRVHCKRLGFDLPAPDVAEFIFLPSTWPPSLSLNWKGYRVIEPVMIEIRGPAWWWRVYQPKAPVADLVAERSVGTVRLEMGPVPLPSEVAAMVQIAATDREFEAWDMWFARHGAKTLLKLDKPIWAPTRTPPALHEPRDLTPDFDAIDEALGAE
jgi:hypothetical protein